MPNNDDFEELMRKAMASEMDESVLKNCKHSGRYPWGSSRSKEDGDTDGDSEVSEGMKAFVDILSCGNTIKLAKAAMERKNKIIRDLREFLQKLDPNDGPKFDANAAVKIISAASKIRVLDVLISGGVVGGTANLSGESMDEVINTIIRINTMM